MKYATKYVPPILTVDAVIFRISNDVLEVLLIKRANQPFKGAWALPGGYNARGETTTEALGRVVKTKAGVDINQNLPYIEQLYTFDLVDRDPRGHAVSVTYMGCGRNIQPSDGNSEFMFCDINNLPNLAYDHNQIISYAYERLINKVTYSNTISAFLPDKFTLTKLQTAYETILGHALDKRNFRKKFLSLEMVYDTGETWREGAHRPAKLYSFKTDTQSSQAKIFD